MPKLTSPLPFSEGYLVEFKEFSGGFSTKELAITLCAFANTEGGDIYLGVTDKGKTKGIDISVQLLDAIQNAAREGCSPPVSISLDQISLTNEKFILKISTPKSPQLHTVVSGQVYVRIGTQDKRVLGDELLRLAESKSQVSFEDTILEAGLEVLDLSSIEEYYRARKNVSSGHNLLTPQDLLSKIGLAQQKPIFRIRAGAFILFGKQDEELLLQRDFTFVRYDSGEKMYTYREDVRLPISKMLRRLLELIRPHNQRVEGVRGLIRQERFYFPEEAIREALLNAFAHRDYRVPGLRNECRMYPDRIEFISVGGLPSVITLENMSYRHYSRNPKITHALLILGFVEELGQGISLMKEALKKNGNPEPEFSATADQVKVIFRKAHEPKSKEDITMLLENFFAANNRISRRQLEALLNIRTTSAKSIIKNLLSSGYLRQTGSGPQTRYERNR